MESNGVWKFWNRLELVFYKNLSQKKAQCLHSLRITRPLTLFAELNDTALYGSQRPLTFFAELNDTALYGSLIFASQRAFDYAPLSTAISLSMDRSIGFGTRCKIESDKFSNSNRKDSDCKLLKVFEENLPTIRIGFDIRLIFRFPGS
ncbi:Uncharacterized protein XB16_1688 [Leptospira santarosai]|uniref:Uncharacterized protein n=1 Tax=Leptospira santarosai TaxID=28183 RepID=A0A2P1QSX5_9LEPT|nr:Uncharacterized protein XB16_1688 [Leptospira santarosai]